MKRGRTATPAVAEALIRKTGHRVTTARVQILTLLLNAGSALTHNEVEDQLGKNLSVDRVTVYRVLDWLTQVGLARRITESDRIWRFIALTEGRTAASSAHFTCTCCSQTIVLPGAAPQRRPRLPPGYRARQMELSVRGLCADCSRPNHSPAAHAREGARRVR
ncbi:MAG TPA: transcriptional repressor [Burkholderiales bacterium]|jgi:Fur family ferric uptake transcriptional regulator|nr:transcriptional repressor [Burkholderiales bacterium]